MQPRLYFGQYAGRAVEDIPLGYLRWLLDAEVKLPDGTLAAIHERLGLPYDRQRTFAVITGIYRSNVSGCLGSFKNVLMHDVIGQLLDQQRACERFKGKYCRCPWWNSETEQLCNEKIADYFRELNRL